MHCSSQFVAQPLHLNTIFRLTCFFQRLRFLGNSISDHKRYPFLALCSSKRTASLSPISCRRCWYYETSLLLESIGISINQLTLLIKYLLDAPPHLLPSRSRLTELSKMIFTNDTSMLLGLVKTSQFNNAYLPAQLSTYTCALISTPDVTDSPG